MKLKYRVENINVPEHHGIAQPDSEWRELNGRRIVHVLSVAPAGTSQNLRVLTEEAE